MPTIPLKPEDLADALRAERTIQAAADALHIAEHQMETATTAHKRLVAHLRVIYHAPEGRYEMRDWAKGFEEVTPNA
jgi:hypothetical protein